METKAHYEKKVKMKKKSFERKKNEMNVLGLKIKEYDLYGPGHV